MTSFQRFFIGLQTSFYLVAGIAWHLLITSLILLLLVLPILLTSSMFISVLVVCLEIPMLLALYLTFPDSIIKGLMFVTRPSRYCVNKFHTALSQLGL